jgi:hypothetical protein
MLLFEYRKLIKAGGSLLFSFALILVLITSEL